MATSCDLVHPRREGRAEDKDYILPLVFAKRLCDVFADEVNRISQDVAVAQPGSVTLDRVAQQYARVTTGIGTDQLWAALRQWGAATLTGREGL